MILHLPAVLQSYPNSPAAQIQIYWSVIVGNARLLRHSNPEEMSVTTHWTRLFDFLALLCHELGCQLSDSYQILSQTVGVRMDWLLQLNAEDKLGGEAKTETVLQHHAEEMEALSQVPWLGWERSINTATDGRAIVLKVSQLILFMVSNFLSFILVLSYSCLSVRDLSTNRVFYTSAACYVACCQKPALGRYRLGAVLSNHSAGIPTPRL
jgi:hypothetical protein